jgi:hypothetical protein
MQHESSVDAQTLLINYHSFCLSVPSLAAPELMIMTSNGDAITQFQRIKEQSPCAEKEGEGRK